MSATPTKKTANRNAVVAITTCRIPVTDAFATTWAWWEERDLLEDLNSDDLSQCLGTILTTCADLQVVHIGALFQQAGAVIAAAADVTSLTQYANAAQRHRVHRTRNLVTAMLWTLAWSQGHNPCSIVDDMPRTLARVTSKHRPAYDDEILLLRLRALYRLQRPPRLAAAGFMYALTEAAVWPSETTRTLVNDFNHPVNPTTVTVRPDASRKDTIGRELPLPAWAQQALPPALAPSKWRDEQDQRCAFGGKVDNENDSATITATQAMGRAIADVGIDDALTSSEIVHWRAQATVRTRGLPAAANLVGFTGSEGITRLERVLSRSAPVAAPNPSHQARSFIGL